MVKHGLLSRILVIHNALISSGAHSRVSILAMLQPGVRHAISLRQGRVDLGIS